MRNYFNIGAYYLTYRSWRATNRYGNIEVGIRIMVELRDRVVLDYYIPPPRDNEREAHKRISAYLHSSRRGVVLPKYLAPKMGNLEYRNMRPNVLKQ